MLVRVTWSMIGLLSVAASLALPGAAAPADQGRIVLVTNRSENLWRLAVYSVRFDGRAHRLAGRGVPYSPTGGTPEAVLTPKGGRMVILSAPIRVASVSGRGVHEIAPTELWPLDASVSPNGKRLALTAKDDPACEYPCASSVYTVGLNGRRLRRIGSGASPSWAPDSKALAYSSQDELFVRTADGHTRRIGAGTHPLWAPRGHRIAYSIDEGSRTCFVNADGARRRCLSDGGDGHWSPDARRFAYSSSNGLGLATRNGRFIRRLTRRDRDRVVAWSEDSNAVVSTGWREEPYDARQEIRVQRVDRIAPSRVIRIEPPNTNVLHVASHRGRIVYITSQWNNDLEVAVLTPGVRGVRALTQNLVQDQQPDWSPDGRRIIYSQSRRHAHGFDGAALRLVHADGSNNRLLTNGGLVSDLYPSWSPDGRRIAFLRFEEGADARIALLELHTGRLTLLPTPAAGTRVSRISWSPDARDLLFEVRTNSSNRLWVLRLDDGSTRAFQTGCEESHTPEWSPSGDLIAFVGVNCPGDRRNGTFVIGRDGTGLRWVAPNPGYNEWAQLALGSWSPDSTRLVIEIGGQLMVIDVRSRRTTRLTHSRSINVAPSWSR